MRSLARTALGVYTVETGRDVSACQYSADVAGVKNGATIEEPPPTRACDGLALGHRDPGHRADLRRRERGGGPPFSLLIAC